MRSMTPSWDSSWPEQRQLAAVEFGRPVPHLDCAVPEQYAVPELLRHFRRRAACGGCRRVAWEANPALTPAEITTALKQTALPMSAGASGSGSGFIQVDAALGAIPVGAPTLSISAAEIALGSAATLTWASYATSTCTASGDWSGTQATAGSLQLTPTATGSLSYSLACTGAAGTGATRRSP